MAYRKTPRIGVIGAGAWGTALSNLLAEKGYVVDLWVREQDVYDAFKQVVINLLDNAIKYSGNHKEIRIKLVTEKERIRNGGMNTSKS